MSVSFESTDRFLRPADAGRLRRNHRRVQANRVLAAGRNVLVVAIVLIAAFWSYRRTQSDGRFAVRHIEITGAVHTPRAALEKITGRYTGLNLFKLDIGGLRHDLTKLAWVSRVDIQKKLPDTLRIQIAERQPRALFNDGARLRYVDGDGNAFAELSTSAGDDELPVISGPSSPAELVRTILFIEELKSRDPHALERISEIKAVAPRGFALFDRNLGAFIYANDADVSKKWRELDAIIRAEGLHAGGVEYADLRFNDRIIIKPTRVITTSAQQRRSEATSLITN